MKLNYKWKQEIHNRLNSLSLQELIDEFGRLGGGDSWDGAFTERGWWECQYAQYLLTSKVAQLEAEVERLREILGWVKSPCKADERTFAVHCKGCEKLHSLEGIITEKLKDDAR